MELKPFFSYFGSKYRIAPKYPKPKYDTIIEPFAGSAGYSLHYAERKIILIDLNPIVIRLWQYLISVSEEEIVSLPAKVQHVEEIHHLQQEAQWLIQFWLTKGTGYPRKTLTKWAREDNVSVYCWSEKCRDRIASQLQYIRHWKAFCWRYYEYYSDKEATYFLDPPYQHQISKEYTFRDINYEHLSYWCKTRKGQVIVCEKEGANWLPFRYLTSTNGVHQKSLAHEVIWTNEKEI